MYSFFFFFFFFFDLSNEKEFTQQHLHNERKISHLNLSLYISRSPYYPVIKEGVMAAMLSYHLNDKILCQGGFTVRIHLSQLILLAAFF